MHEIQFQLSSIDRLLTLHLLFNYPLQSHLITMSHFYLYISISFYFTLTFSFLTPKEYYIYMYQVSHTYLTKKISYTLLQYTLYISFTQVGQRISQKLIPARMHMLSIMFKYVPKPQCRNQSIKEMWMSKPTIMFWRNRETDRLKC